MKNDEKHEYFVIIFIKNTDLVIEWLYTNVIRDTAHQNILQAHSESVVSVRGFTATILQLHADNNSFFPDKTDPRTHTHTHTHTEECKVNARHDDSNETQAWKYLHAHLHLQQLTRLQEHFYNTLLWVLDRSLKMMTSYIHLLTAGDQTTPCERFPSDIYTGSPTF